MNEARKLEEKYDIIIEQQEQAQKQHLKEVREAELKESHKYDGLGMLFFILCYIAYYVFWAVVAVVVVFCVVKLFVWCWHHPNGLYGDRLNKWLDRWWNHTSTYQDSEHPCVIKPVSYPLKEGEVKPFHLSYKSAEDPQRWADLLVKIMIYPFVFAADIFVFLCVGVVLSTLSLPISLGIWATVLLLVSVLIRRKCHGGGSR